MSKVFADNEEVVFDEGVPDSASTVHDLLMNAFAQRRRAMTTFEIDGSDFINREEFPAEFARIEATSITHAELTMRLSIEFLNQLSNFEKQVSAYQVNLLVTPWSEVFKRTDEFISKIQPFADLVDNIMPFAQSYEPEWADKIYQIAKLQANSLSQILKCFENTYPSGLSDELASQLLPLFLQTVLLFETTILPDLKKRQEEDERAYSN